jgi:hypothetical protein
MIGVEHDSRPPVTSNGSAGTSPNAAAASRSLPTTPDPSLSLHCLLAIMVMATQSGIVRGQRDLAAFAAKLTQFQLRTLGSYRKRSGGRDYPKETTFQRILIDWEIQRAGQVADDDQIAIPDKGNHPELQARAAACLPDRSPAVISTLGPAPGHQPAAGAVRYLHTTAGQTSCQTHFLTLGHGHGSFHRS